jgi:hypothetical protein
MKMFRALALVLVMIGSLAAGISSFSAKAQAAICIYNSDGTVHRCVSGT